MILTSLGENKKLVIITKFELYMRKTYWEILITLNVFLKSNIFTSEIENMTSSYWCVG